MRWVLLVSIVLGMGTLTLTQYITSDAWIHFLMATGGFSGLAVAMSVAMLIRRWTPSWKQVTALILALAAAIARTHLLTKIYQARLAPVEINFIKISLALSTVIWGTLALIWGTLALNDLLQSACPKRFLILPMMAIALALYSVAPLLGILGLTVNIWTLLGLFGLGTVAYGMGAIFRWLAKP